MGRWIAIGYDAISAVLEIAKALNRIADAIEAYTKRMG